MAIRISSNTPQQQEAPVESFGYVRNYRSPLEGVQAADAGRGLQQAGQSIQGIASLMQRKEDEANRIVADSAHSEYQSRLLEANNNLEIAIRNQNQENISKYKGELDAFNPENKGFSLNNYSEKQIDSKYYAGYMGSLKTNYKKYTIAHSNAENQFIVTNKLDDDLSKHSGLLATLRQKDKLSDMEFDAYIESTNEKATNSAIDSLSSQAAKNLQRNGYSNLVLGAFTEKITRSFDLEELEDLGDKLLDELSEEGGLNTYLNEVDQRAIESAIQERVKFLTDEDNKQIKEYHAKNYKAGGNLVNQIYSSMNGFDDLQGQSLIYTNINKDLLKSQNILNSVDPTLLEDPEAFESKQVLNSFLIPPAGGFTGGLSVLQAYVHEYVRTNGDFVVPSDERLTISDYNRLKSAVKRIGDNALTEANVNDDGKAAADILYGYHSVDVNTKDILGSVNLSGTSTIVESPTPYPKQNVLEPGNEDAARKNILIRSEYNRPGDLARKANALKNKVTNKDQAIEAIHLELTAGEMIRGGNVDDLSVFFFDTLRRAEAATEADKALLDQYMTFAATQPEFMQPEIFKLLQEPDVLGNSMGEVLQDLLLGVVIKTKQSNPSSFFQNNDIELFNQVGMTEAQLISSRLGYAVDYEGVSVSIPPNLVDRVELKRKRKGRGVLGLLNQTVGFSRTFAQMFKGIGSKKILASELAENVAQSAIYYMVKNGDIRYLTEAGEALKFESPLLQLFPEIKTQLELSELSDKELFEGLLSATVPVGSGEMPAIRIRNYAEDDVLKETGLLVEYYDINTRSYRPFKYTDNRLAVIPLDTLEASVDVIQSSYTDLIDLIPGFHYSDGQVYDMFESKQ